MQNFILHVVGKHVIDTDVGGGRYVAWDAVYEEIRNAIPNITDNEIRDLIQHVRTS